MKLYKIKFKSSLHIGEREDFLETTDVIIHSDTLFSAFCHAYFLLYGKERLEILLNKFINQFPPFLISSAFPWWDEKLYFPVPFNQLPKEKEAKKIKFIEKDGFERLLKGENIERLINENYKIIKEDIKPYKIVDTPRVSLSRLTNHPGEEFFHFGEVFYRENSGLFFLVDFIDKEIGKEFDAVLNLMQDEGMGGDRTIGKGHFEKEKRDIDIVIPKDAQGMITLSLYHPQKDELKDIKDGYYEIVERRGYLYSAYAKNLRRKTVRMFKEGSLFISKKIGDIVDVTPEVFKEHKIYRYGLAFTLPCSLEVKYEN